MGKKVSPIESQPPVVVAVLEDFINRLRADSSVDSAVVTRLRNALIDGQESSADALRVALFSEELVP